MCIAKFHTFITRYIFTIESKDQYYQLMITVFVSYLRIYKIELPVFVNYFAIH